MAEIIEIESTGEVIEVEGRTGPQGPVGDTPTDDALNVLIDGQLADRLGQPNGIPTLDEFGHVPADQLDIDVSGDIGTAIAAEVERADGAYDPAGAAAMVQGNPPTGLDSVEKLANAINNDPSFAGSVGNEIASAITDLNLGDIVTHDASEFDAVGAAATAESNANSYTDDAIDVEVARANGAYDANGAAGTAESNAADYTDGAIDSALLLTVLKTLFDANTMLVAILPDTPVAKTRAEVLAFLSAQATADFDLNGHRLINVQDPSGDQHVATKKWVLDTVVAGAGAAYDTLLEFQNIVTNDESVASALAATVAGKVAKSLYDVGGLLVSILDETPIFKTYAEFLTLLSGQLVGDFSVNGHKITNLADPVGAQDADTLAARNAAITALSLGTASTHAHTEYLAASLVDAKGDQYVGSANDTVIRKAVGTDGQLWTADAASTGGIKWADPVTFSPDDVNTVLGSRVFG